MKRFLLFMFLLFNCLLFVIEGESRGKPVTDYTSLIDNLRAAGIIVKRAGEVVQPFFSVKGMIIKVRGEDVQVFQYSHKTETDAQAAQVSPDGSTVGTTKIHWIGTPHFYKSEKLLVLYVGDNDNVLKALDDVLGQQFASK